MRTVNISQRLSLKTISDLYKSSELHPTWDFLITPYAVRLYLPVDKKLWTEPFDSEVETFLAYDTDLLGTFFEIMAYTSLELHFCEN